MPSKEDAKPTVDDDRDVRCPDDQPSDAGVVDHTDASVDAGDNTCPVVSTITPGIAKDGVRVSLRVDTDDPDPQRGGSDVAWWTSGGMSSNADSPSDLYLSERRRRSDYQSDS